MRSILFSLTLVFFTGCLTEATPTNPADDLDDVGAVAVDPSDPDLTPADDARAAADREMRLELVRQGAPWGMSHQHPVRPDSTPEEPDCGYAAGKPVDPRCTHHDAKVGGDEADSTEIAAALEAAQERADATALRGRFDSSPPQASCADQLHPLDPRCTVRQR